MTKTAHFVEDIGIKWIFKGGADIGQKYRNQGEKEKKRLRIY